jgi:hypothetical protein
MSAAIIAWYNIHPMTINVIQYVDDRHMNFLLLRFNSKRAQRRYRERMQSGTCNRGFFPLKENFDRAIGLKYVEVSSLRILGRVPSIPSFSIVLRHAVVANTSLPCQQQP